MTDAAKGSDSLTRIASVALAVGAIGSLVMFIRFARNTPPILLFLYTGWILLPFAGALWMRNRMAKRSDDTGRLMNYLAIFLAVKSLAVYVGASVLALAPRPAAIFLLTPLTSWVFLAMAYAVAAWLSRKPSSPQSS